MKNDGALHNISQIICKNIDELAWNRGLLSQNILSNLRNFVEHIAVKIKFEYDKKNSPSVVKSEINYRDIEESLKFIKSHGQYSFLSKFHKLLQRSVSHYSRDENNSERLMLKYYEYLLYIKNFLKDEYNIEVLDNLAKFPLNLDTTSQKYYEKIAEKIIVWKNISKKSERYYIESVKPFFVNQQIYYEVIFTPPYDIVSKFDRFVAFSKFDIPTNYAMKLTILDDEIDIFGKTMPIKIISNYEYSIRGCEFKNFAKIFGLDFSNKNIVTKEYDEIMSLLKSKQYSLLDFIQDEELYNKEKFRISRLTRSNNIFNILDKAKHIIDSKKVWYNILSYLLYTMNNRVIKQQLSKEQNTYISGLYLKVWCLVFEKMPFNSALINHVPKLTDIFDSIDYKNREEELVARFIENNIKNNNILYTPIDNIDCSQDIDLIISKYNSKIYTKHKEIRKLEKSGNSIYIKWYVTDTVSILNSIKNLSWEWIKGYENSINNWINNSFYNIDDELKKDMLKKMFLESKVACVYGSAGTWKTTLISHISNFYADKNKIFLANTHSAVDNLRNRIKAPNSGFYTISSVINQLKKWLFNENIDILVIDECSTVSNEYMKYILDNMKFMQLILVWDVYQIEAINFWNWFYLLQYHLPKNCIFELQKPYRTSNEQLLKFWNEVRECDDWIVETIVYNDYSMPLNENIFEFRDEDEIILCFNYDGIYWINNINRYLQLNNPNDVVTWWMNDYKIWDPILFNELVNSSWNFGSKIFNNLKWKIVNITKDPEKIRFDIEIETMLDESDTIWYDFDFISNEWWKTIISFDVWEQSSSDEDKDFKLVPFQIAYAVSIHKSQWLEYNSVKIVFTDQIEDLITHNIFYTAITRAKEKLKIYWSPETEQKIIKKFKDFEPWKIQKRDYRIIESNYGI